MKLVPTSPVDHSGSLSAPSIDVGEIVPLDVLRNKGKVTLPGVDTIWELKFRAILRKEGRGGEGCLSYGGTKCLL